ncbi:agmatine deiminase family protein [Pelagicoccus enzymogenes]|uniref:agmatine deiminase family protein n=1 Tax=Pelagicoccus enzymogenes TaxID=2773457 RepID=UPI00280C9891|nr:agmatine deiminase family protein [Pelagicoccus enzymogenes]MDQ8197282.1 agmatine deiminase family protein [Pelagicoccus enzymogenes]
MKTKLRSLLAVSTLFYLPALCDAQLSDVRTETIRSAPEGFFNLLTFPTEPLPVARLIAEWDPAQALLVSIPVKEFLRDESMHRFYGEYLSLALRHTQVVIAYDVADTRYLTNFEETLLKHLENREASEGIRYAPTRSRSIWIRDNGPTFAFDERAELIVIDSIYRQLEGEIDAFSNSSIDVDSKDLAYDLEAFVNFRQAGRNDDVTPLFLAKAIRQDLGVSCDTVRPPLHLQGGDFMTDGEGNVFVSEDTILANGGRKRHVESILQQYFGAEEVHVLNALPGATAKHLDLLLKPLSPRLMLYVEPPNASDTARVYSKRMSREVKAAQETNLSYLRKQFPDMELVSLPMPPIIEDNASHVVASIRNQLIIVVCEQAGINYLRYHKLAKGSAERESANRMIGKAITEAVGRPLDLGSRDDLDIACQAFLGSGLDALEHFHVSSTTVYRSYANSVILKTPEGETVVFLPRYKAVEGESQADFDRYESEVEAAYRIGYPDAILYWVDCDAMVRRLGALHCLSMTIPAPL